MKTLRLLAVHNGEFQYTSKSPIKEFNPETDTELLKELTTALLSNDDWREIKVNKYAVIEVNCPDWVNAEYYIEYDIQLKWYFGFGADINWSKKWFEKLMKLESNLKYACIKLLRSNLRSEFRKSLKQQLENWLNEENNKYAVPFSPKQISILLDKYTHREHECLAEKLYWQR